MSQTPYTTPLRSGSWSVGMHEHHTAGVNSGYPTRQVGSYEADQSRLGEIGRGVLSGYTTRGGANPEHTPERRGVGRSSTPATVISHSANGRDNDYAHASVRMWTPEGHELSTEHVQGVMAGTHDAQSLREHYADEHEMGKQRDFESKVRSHIYRNGGLPHSGVDALMAGVPTADSPAGSHIMQHVTPDGRGGGNISLNATFPHHSGDTSLENPSTAISNKRMAAYRSDVAAGTPSNRAGHPGRVVGTR